MDHMSIMTDTVVILLPSPESKLVKSQQVEM